MTDVGGYRVLRAAARGARCRLLVGHHDGETVVLKVAEAGDPAFAVEAEALSRAAGEHVVALLDAAADAAQAILVLERLGGGTLGELLDRRGALGAGEAVTLLAPIAETVERMHGAGVAHGDLSLASVCLADDGAPVLVGFGRAELFAPETPEVVRGAVVGVVADRAALRGIAALVLVRVAGPRADAARRIAASLDGMAPTALAAALYDLAVPEPVVEADPEPVAWRVLETREPEPPSTPPTALPGWLVAFVPDPFRERVEAVAALVRGHWAGWTPTRRRIVLGGAAAVLTVVTAVALVPPGDQDAVAVPAPTSMPSDEPAAMLPEDPVDAAVLLLALRERCIRDLSVLCLEEVVQSGSAAADEDRALIAAIESGAEVPSGEIRPGDPVLVERLGDSALVDLPEGSEPASILLMRMDAGWRIRDYFPAVPGEPVG